VVYISSDRRHIQRCKTDHSYATAHEGHSWMCQTHLFLGVHPDKSTTLWVIVLIHISFSSRCNLFAIPLTLREVHKDCSSNLPIQKSG
jgi:hypothetical protein